MQYDYDTFLAGLGCRVKELRTNRGLSHRVMIIEHGFHLNQLHRIESGKGVSVQTLLKLCGAFDLRIEDLMRDL
jgi:DNA-binding Xre family transcriptional regulator